MFINYIPLSGSLFFFFFGRRNVFSAEHPSRSGRNPRTETRAQWTTRRWRLIDDPPAIRAAQSFPPLLKPTRDRYARNALLFPFCRPFWLKIGRSRRIMRSLWKRSWSHRRRRRGGRRRQKRVACTGCRAETGTIRPRTTYLRAIRIPLRVRPEEAN